VNTLKNPASKWMRYRVGREYVQDTIYPLFKKYNLPGADAIGTCGSFVYSIDCNSCNTKHFAGFRSCTNRYCIPCNYKKSLVWLSKLYPVIEKWLDEGNTCSLLNFTVRDGQNLTERLDFLYNSFRNLYNNDKYTRKLWKDRFPGGIRSLEVKLGKNSKEWHPHYHCLVLQYKSDIFIKDIEWLIPEWHNKVGYPILEDGEPKKDSSGNIDYNGSVWIKSVSKKNLTKSILETIKYILKFEKTIFSNDETFLEVFESMRGKRQVNTWGLLRGLSKEVDDEFESWEERQLENFVCKVCGCKEGELRAYYYSEIIEAGVPLLNID